MSGTGLTDGSGGSSIIFGLGLAWRQIPIEEGSVTVADITQRLWDAAHFRHVYALREPSDFAYD